MADHTQLLYDLDDAASLSYGNQFFEDIGRLVHKYALADYTFITKIDETKIAQPIVSIKKGELIPNANYNLNGTPCMEVTSTCVGFYPSSVFELFPNDEMLADLSIQGYLGAAIMKIDQTGPFAIITCLYEEVPQAPNEYLDLIKFVATSIENRAEREFYIAENIQLKEKNSKQSEEIYHREILLKELHHRVKNNLQIISSLLRIQKTATNNQEVQDILDISRDRIQSIALVHELLYSSQQVEKAEVGEYIEMICNTLASGTASAIDFKYEIDRQFMKMHDLIPIGLILCEAVTNFIKYAADFNSKLDLTYRNTESEILLKIQDYGPGFPEHIINKKMSQRLGLEIIDSLAAQVGGTAKFYNNGGAVIEINIYKIDDKGKS